MDELTHCDHLSHIEGEYGIVANCIEIDRLFRLGAKVWLGQGTGGEGWHRFVFIGLARGGRYIEKWTPTFRFDYFRPAWIPPHLCSRIWGILGTRGTREEMTSIAKQLNVFAKNDRAAHPNR
ncbi:MAG TPA: hypothetical protein VGQ76_27335, partial [Thermoanaerobaculia bacterium]|nr:hypothetical protein [Thermoanaerobaculia bacterium]